ncbi:MAG: GMP synthase [Alphaproteobacteria bacterium]
MADIYPPYQVLFEALLCPALPEARFGHTQALDGELPAVDDYDAYVVTGSPATAFDREPWMLALEDFMRRAAAAERKVVGICFGHQLAAQAFGGKVERRGWGLGVRTAQATKPDGLIDRADFAAIVSHQDQVTILPEGAEVLASSDFCPYEAMTVGRNVFSVQGHPEMTMAIAKALVELRHGELDQPTYERFAASLATSPHNAEMGRWIGRFVRG